MELKNVMFGNASVENGEVSILMSFSITDQDFPKDDVGTKNLADILEVAGNGEMFRVKAETEQESE